LPLKISDSYAEVLEGIPPSETRPPDFVPYDKDKKIQILQIGEVSYPAITCPDGTEGVVMINAWMNDSGIIRRAEITSSTNQCLNQSALKAAMHYKFTPAYVNGIPTAIWIKIPIRFRRPQ
jgi:TonB family protein